MDRKRKKKGSNQEWVNPHDPDARITQMKDGSTHLAHMAEHAVDMETGAVVAVALQEADLGDTTTVKETLAEAGTTVAELIVGSAKVSSSSLGAFQTRRNPKPDFNPGLLGRRLQFFGEGVATQPERVIVFQAIESFVERRGHRGHALHLFRGQGSG
ncbi:MAG TPA: hypothetical protein VLY24_02535 [Bryobacteraceae bacterium]|nr:hypothetical protein [Bryobacteraceae bacterium]